MNCVSTAVMEMLKYVRSVIIMFDKTTYNIKLTVYTLITFIFKRKYKAKTIVLKCKI